MDSRVGCCGDVHCVPKMSLLCLAIGPTSDVHGSNLIIFGTNVTEKVGNQQVLHFLPHLIIVSALPGEVKKDKTRNRKHRQAAAKPAACAHNAVNTREQGKEGGMVR